MACSTLTLTLLIVIVLIFNLAAGANARALPGPQPGAVRIAGTVTNYVVLVFCSESEPGEPRDQHKSSSGIVLYCGELTIMAVIIESSHFRAFKTLRN